MFHNVDLLNIINGIPNAVFLLDKKLSVRGINTQAVVLTGRSSEEAAGLYADHILRSNMRPFAGYFDAVIKDKRSVSHEGNVLDQNRKIVPVRFSISPLVDKADKTVGAMMVIEDLTVDGDRKERASGSRSYESIVSLSPRVQEVSDHIHVFAGTDATVLIEGETGTGKASVAETIHQESRRAGYPYIKINCRALPESLLESEIFGHVPGAIAGEERGRQGMLRLADRGTIFFSGIEDMPLSLQGKLLAVLDDGEFSPLGSAKKIAVNVRILAATNRDLKALVRERRFREDLFYRLQVLRLQLPTLRDRAEDIPLLIDHYARSSSPGGLALEFEPEAMRILMAYSFPGNVRELRNIVEHAVTLCRGDTVRVEHLPEYVLQEQETGAYHAGSRAGHIAGVHGDARDPGESRAVRWDDVEKEMIIEALRKAGGKRSEAAKTLGWARSTLYRKLKYHEI